MKRLEGKVAVVTGGNSGIGLATAKADVSKLGDTEKFFPAVEKRFGKIDVLFVNAGIAKFVPVDEVSEEHYDEIFDINAKGAYFTLRRALPYLNDGASIILNTSVVSHKGLPAASVYSGTKAAMRSFTRTLAAELAARNIRVNAVAPGPIETPIFERTGLSKEERDDFAKNAIAVVPLKRFRKTGGSGDDGCLPGFKRCFVHYRSRARRGRRDGAGVSRREPR